MKEIIRDYKDLKVWQKALEVVCDIIEMVDVFPSGASSDIVSKQIVSSSTSVCANIAEGHSSGSTREYNRILKIAYREAKETDNWIHIIKKSRRFVKPRIRAYTERIMLKNNEVIRMLSSLKKRIQDRI
jgi:four helix bundle protein